MGKVFNGKRLKEARLYNKMTITKLGEKLGVKKQMISKYENGQSEPSYEKSLMLFDILGYPREFFYSEENFNFNSQGTFFRSRLTATQKSKQPAEYLLKYAVIVRDFLEHYVEFPSLIDIEGNDDDIEGTANKIRNLLKLEENPINDVIEVAELLGITVVQFDYDEMKVDAFSSMSEINKKEYFIIVTGNTRSFYRQQFSLSHEIGHWLLHRDINPQELDKEEYNDMEKQANNFAAAFLLPKKAFTDDFRNISVNIENLLKLKQKWNVSLAAIIERSKQLNLISQDTRNKLYRQINYRGWRNPEPFDKETPTTEPLAINQAMELLIDEKIMTGFEIKSKIINQYNLYITQKMLAEVCNVDESIFDDKGRVKLDLKIKKFENKLRGND